MDREFKERVKLNPSHTLFLGFTGSAHGVEKAMEYIISTI
jgi:hypothetical protein